MVTGASRGIGRAIALRLSRAGAYIVVNYHGNQAAAEESLGAIVAQGGQGELSRFDVSDEDLLDTTVKNLVDRHKKIDILVNNAGVAIDNLLMRTKQVDWDQVIGTNLKGTVLCTKVVSRYMIRQRAGRIINLSSVVGQMGNVGQSLYAASKAGIIGFTKAIARELASRGDNGQRRRARFYRNRHDGAVAGKAARGISSLDPARSFWQLARKSPKWYSFSRAERRAILPDKCWVLMVDFTCKEYEAGGSEDGGICSG